ncbi:MAG: UDP-2,3-diacylglucosamine diphosphatase [Planctomycetota bacterium]|nr:UDP-2,3-diacylglucosamine diphosphatase [Planctomycetota bacterium]
MKSNTHPRRIGDGPRRGEHEYRSVFLSDLHLGTRGCKVELLVDFLRQVRCEHLYLVGDVLDGWSLRKSWYWNQGSNEVVQRILKAASRGSAVTYVCGNHDEFLRRYIGLDVGGVKVVDQAEHLMVDGRRLLVLHGDRFDVTIRNAKWLAHLGDRAYQLSLRLNDLVALARRKLGYPYWSLSAYLKQKVKNAVSYIDHFEGAVLEHARQRGFDGAVCGHIHHAALREVDGMLYANDGDWVESCTALVEHFDGRLEILRWADPGAVAESALLRRRRPRVANMESEPEEVLR